MTILKFKLPCTKCYMILVLPQQIYLTVFEQGTNHSLLSDINVPGSRVIVERFPPSDISLVHGGCNVLVQVG